MQYSLASDRIVQAPALNNFKLTFCYGWCRDGDFLYIGSTRRGYPRLHNHHVIGRRTNVLPTDTFHFWDTTNKEVAAYEKFLIQTLKPKYNQAYLKREKRNRKHHCRFIICVKCGNVFEQWRTAKDECWNCKAKRLRINADLALLPLKAQKFTPLVKLPRS
jgi:hypothetical protein